MTQFLLTCVDYLVGPFLALGVAAVVPPLVHGRSLPRFDPMGPAGLLGTPGTRRNVTATILDGLAVAAAQGRPLTSQGTVWLAESYPKWAVRRRLRAGRRRNLSRAAIGRRAFSTAGCSGRAELAMLQAAQRVGNLPWALREMADSSRRRLAYRVQALAQLLFPPIVILMGW